MSEEIRIENINMSNWSKYKEIRLKALKDSPQAFGASYFEEVEMKDEEWIERIKKLKLV